MKSSFLWIGILLMAFGTLEGVSRSTAVGRIEDAKEYLQELMSSSDTRIPADKLEKAEGIIIVRQVRAGFVFGYKQGKGVALVRDKKNRKWSPPAFVTSREGSLGLQIGGQCIDTIYLLMDKKALKILSNSGTRIGVDASAALGYAGRDAEAKVGPEASILAYSKSQGLYGGATFEGGPLQDDTEANEAAYGIEGIKGEEILFKKQVPMPEEATGLIEELNKYSSP